MSDNPKYNFETPICCTTKSRPAAFTLIENSVRPSGVIPANYKRAGKSRQALLELKAFYAP